MLYWPSNSVVSCASHHQERLGRMGARFAGKYDVLDQEVKLGLQILSAVEAASGRRVQIYCLPLFALQIELPCPPEFIERRFRSAVTLEGQVLEADVDPETENAYVVTSLPGAKQEAGFAAPTMEFNAWRASATHQPANDGAGAATVERPAWPANAAASAGSAEPAVSFTKLFGEAPSGPAAGALKSVPETPTPAAVASAPQPKKPMESFTAFFKVGSSASSSAPDAKPEPFAPRIDPTPAAPPPQAGGFTAFFGASKSNPAASEAAPPMFVSPTPAPAFRSSEPQSSPGGFTQLFGGPSAASAEVTGASVPQAQFTPPASKESAPGSFTAMFSDAGSSRPSAASAEPNFATAQPAKAPGAFTELFRRMPDLQASSSPATSEPVGAPAAPAGRSRSDGFTAIFGVPSAPAPEPASPTTPVAPPASSTTPAPDLAPRLDRPGTATQYGVPGAATPQPQAPPPAAGPSQYTMVRKGWTAPPPAPSPAMPTASTAGPTAAPQMPGAIPAPQWPAPPPIPPMPSVPQMAMPQAASAQPQAPAYPGFQPPAAPPGWPPQAMPPQPAMSAPPQIPMAAPQAPGKSKPSYLPLIIILNALFVLAIVIVLIFVLTKH